MTDYNDPRIEKLPGWARGLIQRGFEAERANSFWKAHAESAQAETDALRAEHARANGAEQFDTWVYDRRIVDEGETLFGLGVGRPVAFGDPSTGCGDWTVTYRDGGLDITTLYGDVSIMPGRRNGAPDVRIEGL